ncbi:MAG: hypothetical protein ACR2L6_13820 [Gemmatimonadaceae bacterium]
MRATRIPIGLLVAMLALTSCDGTLPQEPAPPAVLKLEPVTPVSATGLVGEELAVAPVVRVARADGLPAKGIPVSFVASGSGSVGSATVMTDAAGRATPGSWRLGPGAGPQELTARAAEQSLVFHADAQPGPITTLTVVGGNYQWAAGGMPLTEALRVKATDRYGNVVTGAEVTFAVVDGGGSLEPLAATTGSDGIAESRWTLGTTAGWQRVRAQKGEDVIAQFTARACALTQCNFELAYVLNGNIMVIDVATGATRQLTNNGESYDPAWSPDGERIAFARYILGDEPRWSVYVMNSDGTGVRRVTGPGFRSPTWSPQGDALAFSGGGGIYVQELSEGSVMRQVAASGFEPAWSPDGSRIAFIHGILIGSDDYYSLRLVNLDGSGLTEITPLTWLFTTGPSWAPDGTRIAFSQNWDISVIRADGTGRTQLTGPALGPTTHAMARFPAWSPDGTRIAYGGSGGIMTIPASGGPSTPVTSGQSPSWRPR